MPRLAKKPKPRVHREWFKPVSRGGRKSCPTCRAKLEPGESIWSWGEYVYGKFRAIRDVCKNCWSGLVSDLKAHTDDCGCTVELVPYHAAKPAWMTLGEPICEAPQSSRTDNSPSAAN
jgi:hypothetical protein